MITEYYRFPTEESADEYYRSNMNRPDITVDSLRLTVEQDGHRYWEIRVVSGWSLD